MKNTINILILFFLFLFSNCEKETIEINTTKQPDGTGILKQAISVFDVRSNEAQTINNYEYFDNGKLKKTSYSHPDGIVLAYSDYEYNNENQLGKITEFNSNTNLTSGYLILTTHEFEYFANGSKSKETICHPVIGTFEYITFEYDDEQNMIRKYFYNTDNQMVNYRTYEYDDFGNILKETSYSNKDEQTGETLHYYQDDMLYKSDVYILGNDKVHLEQILKTYDNENNLITMQSNVLWSASSRSSIVFKFIYK